MRAWQTRLGVGGIQGGADLPEGGRENPGSQRRQITRQEETPEKLVWGYSFRCDNVRQSCVSVLIEEVGVGIWNEGTINYECCKG